MRCVRVGVEDAPSRRLTQFELSGLFPERAPPAPRTLHGVTRFLGDARALSGEFRSRMTSKRLTWSRESAGASLQLFRAAARVNRIRSRTFIHIPNKERDEAAHSLVCVHSLSPRSSRHFPKRARTHRTASIYFGMRSAHTRAKAFSLPTLRRDGKTFSMLFISFIKRAGERFL